MDRPQQTPDGQLAPDDVYTYTVLWPPHGNCPEAKHTHSWTRQRLMTTTRP